MMTIMTMQDSKMNNRTKAIEALEKNGEVIIRCNGGSMTPIIYPKEAIHLKRVDKSLLRVGDVVFVRINKNLQVHLISATRDIDLFQISNSHRFVNGWVKTDAIYGLCWKVEDRILVSDAEIVKRGKQ